MGKLNKNGLNANELSASRLNSSDECVTTKCQVSLSAQLNELEKKYQSLKQHTEILAQLSDVGTQMMDQVSMDALLQFIAEAIVDISKANGAYLHMVHETGDYLQVTSGCGPLSSLVLHKTLEMGSGLSGATWKSGSLEYTDNYNQLDSRIADFPTSLKAASIPLFFLDKIIGVVFVTTPQSEDLQAQIPLLQEFVKIASQAINYRKQLDTQANELKRIKALSVLGDTLYESVERDTILHQLSLQLFDIFDIDFVAIYCESNKSGSLFPQVSHRNVNGEIQISGPKPPNIASYGINDWCFKNDQFAQIDRHFDDPRESAEIHQYRQETHHGSTMCVPISNGKKPLGVIVIAKHVDKRNYDESDASAFKSVARQVATALQRNIAVSQVKHRAFHDSLTELPNRASFEKQFLHQLAQDEDAELSVLFCDLDGFKGVNDLHGHDVGDRFIKICAARIKNVIRQCDYLAHMGGDEFAVLVDLKSEAVDIEQLAKRIIKSVSEPVNTNSIRIQLGMSIGMSFYPKDGHTFSELLNHADIAMYQAKHSGKGKVLEFNWKDTEELRNRNILRTELQGALARKEFELWYQPQVNWRSGKVVGVEALIRWHHPEKGMVPPFKFIPVAEESGLIDPMGMWIMEEAIMQLKRLESTRDENFSMGVNIAPPQFIDSEFSHNVLKLIEKHKVNPQQLKAEITESFIMNERDAVVGHLKKLREQGVVVAIDDFGTGYSSLSYLQDLPIDVLKIDRSFVCALSEDNFNTSIAASIIALANSLGLSTITEGVETDEQLAYFKALGSEVIQGYFYSQPVPAAELVDVIEKIESQNALSAEAA